MQQELSTKFTIEAQVPHGHWTTTKQNSVLKVTIIFEKKTSEKIRSHVPVKEEVEQQWKVTVAEVEVVPHVSWIVKKKQAVLLNRESQGKINLLLEATAAKRMEVEEEFDRPREAVVAEGEVLIPKVRARNYIDLQIERIGVAMVVVVLAEVVVAAKIGVVTIVLVAAEVVVKVVVKVAG